MKKFVVFVDFYFVMPPNVAIAAPRFSTSFDDWPLRYFIAAVAAYPIPRTRLHNSLGVSKAPNYMMPFINSVGLTFRTLANATMASSDAE